MASQLFSETTVSLAAYRCLALLAARACLCRLPMAPPAWPWQHPTPSLRCQVRSVPVSITRLRVKVLAHHLWAEPRFAGCDTCQDLAEAAACLLSRAGLKIHSIVTLGHSFVPQRLQGCLAGSLL